MKSVVRVMAGGFGVLLMVLALTTVGLSGCGGGSSDDVTAPEEVAETSAYVGTWVLYEGNAIQGSPSWYVHFKEDQTFFISDNADGTRVRVSGTYSEAGGALVGPFTNPGVGEGRVEATITADVIHLDFIEYWHTPNKVVPYAGTKL